MASRESISLTGTAILQTFQWDRNGVIKGFKFDTASLATTSAKDVTFRIGVRLYGATLNAAECLAFSRFNLATSAPQINGVTQELEIVPCRKLRVRKGRDWHVYTTLSASDTIAGFMQPIYE